MDFKTCFGFFLIRKLSDKIAVFHTPAWTYDDVRDQCYLHQFTPQQPDLNYRNEEVYQNMLDILEYWLDQGADGFRIDAINHMFETDRLPSEVYVNPSGDRTSYDNLIHDHTMNRNESYEFIYDVRKMMDTWVMTKGGNVTRMMMTEAYASIPQQVRWYGASEDKRGSHFPFNFALISELDKESDAKEFQKAIDSWVRKEKFEKFLQFSMYFYRFSQCQHMELPTGYWEIMIDLALHTDTEKNVTKVWLS